MIGLMQMKIYLLKNMIQQNSLSNSKIGDSGAIAIADAFKNNNSLISLKFVVFMLDANKS